jgi:hypothetical protein
MRPAATTARTVAAALLACAALARGPSLGAQPAPDAARVAFEQGMVALQGNRFRDAVEALEASFALRPLAAVSYNLGLAYRGVGRNVDAVEAFERYLRAPDADARPERIEALRREVARLRATLVTLAVALQPPHATLRVDGRAVVIIDRAAVVDPGLRTLDVAAEGYQPLHVERELAPGARVEVDARLLLLENRARLLVDPSVLEATVYVDQHLAGVGQTDVGVAPGRHRVEVIAPGYTPFERSVWSTGRGVVRVSAELLRLGASPEARARPRWVAPLAIAGGAAVAAGVIAALVFALRPTEPVPQGSWATFREAGP